MSGVRSVKRKLWNVYKLEKRKRKAVARFVGSITETQERLERAADDVNRKYGADLFIRAAQTDIWRRPG